MSTPTPAGYARSFDERVRSLLPEAARRSRAFAARLDAAGLDVGSVGGVGALDALGVLGKDDLLALQHTDPPFAGLLADGAPVRRVFQSPGPLYEPELDVSDPWRWAPALQAAGIGSGDLVLNCFGYHLSPAGAMFEEGCRALGARVVPGGVGSPDLQARACADLGVTAYIGLPSYLKALIERAEEGGMDPRAWPLSKAFVTAEPLPGSLRAWLTERVPVVRQGYGTAETGNLGWEVEGATGLVVPADALLQICDLATGEAIYDGREGQVTVTLFNPYYPVVRFGTGDLSAWATEDGAVTPTPRIRGWLGRVGDAVKVRGMFLHPRQVGAVMAGTERVEGWRFVIDRADHRDLLRCEIVVAAGADPATVAAAVRDRVRAGLRFDSEVVAVDRLDAETGAIDDVRSWD